MAKLLQLLILALTLHSWSYARHDRVSRHKKLTSVKGLNPVFLTVGNGKSATMHCPVKPTIMRMYKYIRRMKHGRELEYTSRRLAMLLGLKFKWYKDGRAIRHHRAAWSLKFTKVQRGDAGTYTCKVVSSKAGSSSRNYTLLVFEQPIDGRPSLANNAKNVTLKAGATTFLECISRNTKTRPQMRWLRWRTENNNLHEVTNDIKTRSTLRQIKESFEFVDTKFYEHFELRGQSETGRQRTYVFRLRLENVGPKDSGMYTCLATNKYGSAHKNFFAKVQSSKGVAPYNSNPKKMRLQFMMRPASSSLKLKCYVSGDEPLKYAWYKNGKRLLARRLDPKINTSTGILRLRELVPSDSGLYTCVASNPYGVFKHNVTVKVVERVRSAPILQPNFPKNVSTSKGQNVTLECVELVSGLMPDYRWYRWHSVPSTYPRLDPENSSLYTMINPIHYSPIRVKMGNSLRYGGRLTLTNISQDDIGLYTCVLRNQLGLDYSSAFVSFDARGAPEFLPSKFRPTTINIPVTNVLNIDCSATGNPRPTISWLKNGKPLSSSARKDDVVTSGYTMKLTKLRPQHSGNYTCVVSNSKGTINHTVNVNIQERLFSRPIILPPVKKEIKSGQNYELKCTIVSSEPLKVSWVRLNAASRSKHELLNERKAVKLDKYVYLFSYVIAKATAEDSGMYWCVAKNNLGISSKKFEVQVVEA